MKGNSAQDSAQRKIALAAANSTYNPGPIPNHNHDGSNSNFLPLANIRGYFPQVTSIPTDPPGMFGQSIALNTTTGTLYYFDTTNSVWRAIGPVNPSFYGDGSDGALAISSGTTTIDLGNAELVIKNYTSISVTGTGKIGFINPNTNGTKIVIRSQGNITISSTQPGIDASGMGGAGGTGGTKGTSPTSGASGSVGSFIITGAAEGVGGLAASNGAASPPVLGDTGLYKLSADQTYAIFLACGSGGGGGGAGGSTVHGLGGNGGKGGRGGGALLITCGGNLNFTGSISVNGTTGVQGDDASNIGGGGGGGGGGAAGMCVVMYNTLTSSSGTITVAGGAGDNGGAGLTANQSGVGGSGTGGGGGSGASRVQAGGAGGNPAVSVNLNGSPGSAGGLGAGGGGGGGGTGTDSAGSHSSNGGAGGSAGTTAADALVVENQEFPG